MPAISDVLIRCLICTYCRRQLL